MEKRYIIYYIVWYIVYYYRIIEQWDDSMGSVGSEYIA